MTFSVVTALRQSLRRLATGPALLVLLGFVIVRLLIAFVPGRIIRLSAPLAAAGTSVPTVVFTGNPLPVVALVVWAVVLAYLSLVTIRVFAGQWGIVEREHLTRRVGFGLANLLAIGILLTVVLAIGLFILVVLLGVIGVLLWFLFGLAVFAAAFFAPAFAAVEGDSVLTAFRKSGRVAAQNPQTVVALAVALAVVNLVLQVVGTRVVTALGSFVLLGVFVLAVASALGVVFIWIAIARAYDQLDTTPA
jgi:hypothetical protein